MKVNIETDVDFITNTFLGRRYLYTLLTDLLGFDIINPPIVRQGMSEWELAKHSIGERIFHSLNDKARNNFDKMKNEAIKGDYNDANDK